MTCTPSSLREFVASLPGGVIRSGQHPAGTDCCILEAVAGCEGVEKTDDPFVLRRPDIRPLNDANWPTDAARTAQMLRLDKLLAAWPTWSVSQRVSFVTEVTLRTINARGVLSVDAASTIAASTIADAADDVHAIHAIHAARAAACVAARAAAYCNWSDSVLIRAIDIWVEETDKILSESGFGMSVENGA